MQSTSILALIVGAGAGGGGIVFRWLIKTFTLALSGHADYDALESSTTPALPVLDSHGEAVVGWLTHQRVLSALRRGLPAPAP